MQDFEKTIEDLELAKQYVLGEQFVKAKEILSRYLMEPDIKAAVQEPKVFHEYIKGMLDKQQDIEQSVRVSIALAYVAIYPTIPEHIAVASAHNSIIMAIAVLEILAGKRKFE